MITRRGFLASGLTLLTVPQDIGRLGRSTPRFRSSPFTLGVASGDPTPDGVVLWTRLAPDPLNGGGMPPERVDVAWQVASDDRMKDVVRKGTSVAIDESAHSVHVEVEGLRPDRPYWYQFRVGNELSPIGRTRTLPVVTASVDRLRFAFVSCQNFEMGYFASLHHLASEDLDLVFHLGDYIYEGAGRDGLVRRHNGGEAMTVQDYRNRYAQYKVNDMKLDFSDPKSPTVATELVGSSISSGGDGTDLPDNIRSMLAENDFVKFYNGQRGYVACDVTGKRTRADYRVVEYVTRPGAPAKTRATFVIENGRPGAERA